MTVHDPARRTAKKLCAVTFLLVSLAGCFSFQPFEPRNHREEGPDRGIFTGRRGAFELSLPLGGDAIEGDRVEGDIRENTAAEEQP
jgi:hypothetical protein